MSFLLVKPIYNTRKLHRDTEFQLHMMCPLFTFWNHPTQLALNIEPQGQILDKRIQFMEKKVVEDTK